MKDFFDSINRTLKTRELEIVWEPRGSWNEKIIKDLCEKLNLSHCSDPFVAEIVHAMSIAYFRLHGTPPGKKMYYYDYTEQDPKKLSEKCKIFGEKDVYCLFNNVQMYKNALTLQNKHL
jgi:uncharacterized protein YecE (DUF72 family)